MDPDVARVLEEMATPGGPPAHELPVDAARVLNDTAARELGGEPQAVSAVLERRLPGPSGTIPMRAYRPAAAGAGDRLPVVAWLHGGGWVTGSLEGFDSLCRAIANASGCLVVLVDYRLAPEHRFPAALEDTLAAVRWLGEQADELGGDGGRLALAGDSAGGNLAAVAARRLRDEGPGRPPAMQLLVYPVCDGACSTPSYRNCDDGFGLSAAEMQRYFDLYLDGASALHPDVSPLRAGDLSGLPPAWVLTAEHDPLRDEGEAYAHALAAAGVPVVLRRYPGVVHGFFRWLGAAAIARRAVADVGAALRRVLVEGRPFSEDERLAAGASGAPRPQP